MVVYKLILVCIFVVFLGGLLSKEKCIRWTRYKVDLVGNMDRHGIL